MPYKDQINIIICKSNISNDFSFTDISKYWNKKIKVI